MSPFRCEQERREFLIIRLCFCQSHFPLSFSRKTKGQLSSSQKQSISISSIVRTLESRAQLRLFLPSLRSLNPSSPTDHPNAQRCLLPPPSIQLLFLSHLKLLLLLLAPKSELPNHPKLPRDPRNLKLVPPNFEATLPSLSRQRSPKRSPTFSGMELKTLA